jgi:protein-tyrosine phosphatase
MIILINENQKKILEDSLIGQRVKVYYNLHKHTFSVQKNGLVVMHADYIKLENLEFKVRPTGKEKVRQEKSKNVHAFVIGNLVDYCKYPCDEIPEEPTGNIVTYNPYRFDSFVYQDTELPVYNATEVDLINSRNKLFVITEIKK